jgi:NAD(P)-dependent dehydrogenase (short-subunit alcohol dehydrogenase family)
MKIPGSVSIVTGGCSGLGKATVDLFTSLGGKVLFVDLNAELGAEFAAGNENAEFMACDVTNET